MQNRSEPPTVELYLTNEAEYEPDHVHEDAEKIEHVIGEKNRPKT